MRGWNQLDDVTWLKDGCRIFVYRETDRESATFNPDKPFVVATVDHGEPTGERGEYECFARLCSALSRAQFRHDEMAGAL